METQVHDNIRTAVLNFILRKKKEQQAKGKEWLGWYHNGTYGASAPTADVILTMNQEGSIHAAYTVGNKMWNFTYKQEELN